MATTIIVDGLPLTFGDTSGVLGDHTQGGDDTLIEGADFLTLYGDAWAITGFATGGDDYVRSFSGGGSGTSTTAIGDAETISGHGHGGDDTVSASGTIAGGATTFGDARTMSGYAVGGDDLLLAPGPRGAQYGDAQWLSGHVQCGNDTINAPDSTAFGGFMFGDGQTASGSVRCGDDVLISGNVSDHMWGDVRVIGPGVTTGADRFVFAPANGQDAIEDFEPGKDVIELDGFGPSSFADLATHMQDTDFGVQITFGLFEEILLRGLTVSQLSAGDFILG